jgi:hypothetical protein
MYRKVHDYEQYFDLQPLLLAQYRESLYRDAVQNEKTIRQTSAFDSAVRLKSGCSMSFGFWKIDECFDFEVKRPSFSEMEAQKAFQKLNKQETKSTKKLEAVENEQKRRIEERQASQHEATE